MNSFCTLFKPKNLVKETTCYKNPAIPSLKKQQFASQSLIKNILNNKLTKLESF